MRSAFPVKTLHTDRLAGLLVPERQRDGAACHSALAGVQK
jgi:hypothetical protein